jgi:hypothetical protein
VFLLQDSKSLIGVAYVRAHKKATGAFAGSSRLRHLITHGSLHFSLAAALQPIRQCLQIILD